MVIISGSASRNLAKRIAEALSLPLGNPEISKFSNDELRVRITESKTGHAAIVVQSLSAPVDSHILEFNFICDALHRMGVTDIYPVIPWLAYSKQDKVFRPGEPLSVKVVAKILQVVPMKRLYTFDLHNTAILGFFDIPVTNLTARPLFVEYFRKRISRQTVVVAPDAGAIKISTLFAQELGVPAAYIDKKRDLVTGEVSVSGLSRKVKDAEVILLDDMIVTGGTIRETAKFLKTRGVGTITVAATHHLYVPGAQEAIEASGVDHVVVTDTVEPAVKSDKLHVLSVSGIIAEALSELLN
ncbi:hypothetical protein A2Z33_03355 [Candidatus Gottesmanbacteria bacterium RBG_16_52_11]|uniref:ribose-phosphate diphosphokinase n=1 Tax=Candidatus Gottesmanbacteria bacterium RBG_16_52_11 TaxID=1798374 RepID=A0A1F5YVD0_9BACT|nr:MAG: hypothetical protein A2Z33_03355 [Candidatus Gottesmanbacteria bacterium RBG_16_52_11]